MAISKEIKSMDEFKQILEESKSKPVLLCKFSPVCPTSSMAENEYQSYLKEATDEVSYYHVDVIYSRATARGLVDDVKIKHESPQALYLKNGVCIWNASHYDLTKETFKKKIV